MHLGQRESEAKSVHSVGTDMHATQSGLTVSEKGLGPNSELPSGHSNEGNEVYRVCKETTMDMRRIT